MSLVLLLLRLESIDYSLSRIRGLRQCPSDGVGLELRFPLLLFHSRNLFLQELKPADGGKAEAKVFWCELGFEQVRMDAFDLDPRLVAGGGQEIDLTPVEGQGRLESLQPMFHLDWDDGPLLILLLELRLQCGY